MTTATLNDIERAALLAQRAALLAMLPVVVARPELKAGAVMWLGALEDTLGMERTMPSKAYAPFCRCGCGGRVGYDFEHRRWYDYIITHAPRS